MPPPTSEAAVASDWRVRSPLIAALSAVIFLSAALGGHMFTAVVGAGGFYFFGDRLLAWFVASKTGAAADDTPDTTVEPSLAEVLAKLEGARVDMAAEIERRMRTRLPLGLAGGVATWAAPQLGRDAPGLVPLAILSMMGAAAGWMWAASTLSERYRAMYKSEVLTRLAASFGPLNYRAAEDVDVGALRRQKLLGEFTQSYAEDEIVGTYHNVPVSVVELRLDRRSGDSVTRVFDGLFVRVTLPRTLSGTTVIAADDKLFGGLRDLFRKEEGKRVVLEDPEFERRYQVYGTDQISARALLTPAFMERFLRLGDLTGFRPPVALAEDNRLAIALPKADNSDLFEPPSYDRPAASRAALARLHQDIAAVLGVADAVLDLDQSVRGRASVRQA